MARKLLILGSREPIPDRLLGLDLYMWLTYRTFSLDGQQRLSWPMLYRQFVADPDRASDT